MFGFILSLAVLHQVQSRPADQALSTASDKLHLFVANTSSSNDYHLGPVLSTIENIEDEINTDIQALMPFLNFMFDTDIDSDETDKEQGCDDQMILELVPDHTNPKEILNPEMSQDGPLDVREGSLTPEATKDNEAEEPSPKPESIISSKDKESAVKDLNPDSDTVEPIVEQV